MKIEKIDGLLKNTAVSTDQAFRAIFLTLLIKP